MDAGDRQQATDAPYERGALSDQRYAGQGLPPARHRQRLCSLRRERNVRNHDAAHVSLPLRSSRGWFLHHSVAATCRYLKWRSDVSRSLRLFEDKLALLARATEAEDALLARTVSEMEVKHSASAQFHPVTDQVNLGPLGAGHFDSTQHARFGVESAGFQQALSSSLQQSREEEELQLALALSASVLTVPEPTPQSDDSLDARSLIADTTPTVQAVLVHPVHEPVQASAIEVLEGGKAESKEAEQPSRGRVSSLVFRCFPCLVRPRQTRRPSHV